LGTVTSVAATAGTGISVTGSPITTSGTLNITNTAPDQTVVLTAGTGISTSGTYPNFTITNTSPSAGGDVVGPSSATDNAVSRFDTTTGKLIQNSVVTIDDNGNESGILSEQFSNGSAVTLAAGKLWYNGSDGTFNMGMGGGNITQQVGEELFRYGKASAAITDSPLQLVYKTGVVGASGVITFAPAVAGITDSHNIIGCATENIALNGFGRVTTYGVVNGITTNGTAYGETWADNDDIYYNPVTGGLTKNLPSAPNLKCLIGTVINAGSGGSGKFIVKLGVATYLSGLSDATITSPTGGQLLTYNQTGGYWKNTSLSAGTGITVTPTTGGAITVANTGVTSVTGTSPVVSSGGTTPAISMPAATGSVNGYLTSADWTTFNGKQPAGTYVTSVAATSPVTSSGGTTPTIAMPAATTSVSGYLTSTDWNTFNNKGSGTVTSVTGTAPVVSSGGATPAISMAAATGSVNGYLTSTDWTTFNGKQAALVSGTNIKTVNGTTLLGSGDLSIPSAPTWQSVQTSNFTASAGNAYPINTTSAAITVTFPASPSAGNIIIVTDYAGTWGTNNLIVNPNGNKLDGSTASATLSTNRESISFVYIDSTQGWIPYSGFNDSTPNQSYSSSYLVVAGGGGGGGNVGAGNRGAGGGAGGLLASTLTLTGGTVYTVTVGAGGAGGVAGTNSSLTGVTATVGGGYGGVQNGASSIAGGNGGSGGGGPSQSGSGSTAGGSGTSGQGYAGAAGSNVSGQPYGCGGGGGAGGAGSLSNNPAGTGGVGLTTSLITTTQATTNSVGQVVVSSVYFAGGGGGGTYGGGGGVGGTGGSGGGGMGGGVGGAAANGGTNTGGGGGGQDYSGSAGANGGSGCVLLSVPTANYSGTTTGSPTVVTNGSNTVMIFKSSGSYTA
jgi:hypothetical protein